MRIDVTAGYVTELAKDMIFPAKCPLCGEAVAIEKREAMRKVLPRAAGAAGTAAWGLTGRGDALNDCADSAADAAAGQAAHVNSGAGMRKTLYDGMICSCCARRFEYIRPPYCAKCGKQLKGDKKLCADCSGKERLFIQSRAIFTYDEAARELLASIKYNSRKEYIGVLALMAADRLGAWIRKVSPDFLIPVPVHKKRLNKRGYNQAEELARGLSFYTGVPVRTDILIRVKNTVAQKGLDPDKRLENLQSAFEPGVRLSGGPVAMLIDDIYTTGSTMEACAEALLLAGAGRVYGVCAAAGADIQ